MYASFLWKRNGSGMGVTVGDWKIVVTGRHGLKFMSIIMLAGEVED